MFLRGKGCKWICDFVSLVDELCREVDSFLVGEDVFFGVFRVMWIIKFILDGVGVLLFKVLFVYFYVVYEV